MSSVIEIYAFCSEQDFGCGGEGVIIVATGSGWLPLVSADPSQLQMLKELAVTSGTISTRRVVLKRFELVSTEIVYDPNTGGGK